METPGIELDASIEPLIELLARNVHDLWAQQYDRHVAVGTVRAIVAFGCHLTRNGTD